MTNPVRNGRLTGFLFLLTYLSFLGGAFLILRILPLENPHTILQRPGEAGLFVLGIFLELICGFGIVGIPLLLTGIVHRENRPLAFAYLAWRIAEGGVILFSSLMLMALVPLGRLNPAPGDLVPLIRILYDGVNDYWIPLTLGLGGLVYGLILRREKFVPPLFAFWAIIGYPLTALGGVLEAFGLRLGTFLALPIALYELVFAVYLLINGYGYTQNNKGEEDDHT